MIKYDVGYSKNMIRTIEAVSETAFFVTVKGVHGNYKVKKENEIFDTFDEAKNYLIEHHKRRVISAEANLQSCKAMLKKVNDIPKPTESV